MQCGAYLAFWISKAEVLGSDRSDSYIACNCDPFSGQDTIETMNIKKIIRSNVGCGQC